MKFIDEAPIFVQSGSGGNGCVGLHHAPFLEKGGPDGGNGGKGGDVILMASSRIQTLLDYRYKTHFSAENGQCGSGSTKTGKSGEDIVLPVPVGTVIRNHNEVIAELLKEGETFYVARGGRGGKGNAHFKSSVRQTPRFAQGGEKGEQLWITLELKLMADVGLLGLPNAGKSTLLSKISAAKPKIADYPFTTLTPMLGVVRLDDTSFTVADIPGLIEGAADNRGLGIRFLKHIERTSILWELLDISDAVSPLDAHNILEKELGHYHIELLRKKRIILLTKTDLATKRKVSQIKKTLNYLGHPIVAISSVARQGIVELLNTTASSLQKETLS